MRLSEKEHALMLIAIGGALGSNEVREMLQLRIKPDHVAGSDGIYYLLDAIYGNNKEGVYNLLKAYGVEETGETVIESILNKLRDIVFKGECELSTNLLKNTAQYNPEHFISTLDSIRERMMTYVDEENGN